MGESYCLGPVTIDNHIHYVSSGGHCRPAVVIDAGDGETIRFLFAFMTPDEGLTIWQRDCIHDQTTNAPGTWHYPEPPEIPEY